MNVEQNDGELQNENNIETVSKYTSIFDYALDFFKIRLIFLICSRIYITISQTIILKSLNDQCCQWNGLHYWVLFSDIQALISLIFYCQLFLLSRNVEIIQKIALDYDHAIFVPVDQATSDPVAPKNLDPTTHYQGKEKDRMVDSIMYELRIELPRCNQFSKIINIINHIATQCIFIWTTIYLFTGPSLQIILYHSSECEKWPLRQTFIYGLMLFTQFYKYYLIAALILALLPFILLFLIIRMCANRKKKIETIKALKILQRNKILFQPNVLYGEQECSICMQPYALNDEILQLPCSMYHHFHNFCISAWFQVQTTCPNCRKELLPADVEAPFLEPQ